MKTWSEAVALAVALTIAGCASAALHVGPPARSTCSVDLSHGTGSDDSGEGPRRVTLELRGLEWDGWGELCPRLVEYLRADTSPFEPSLVEHGERLLASTGYFAAVTCTATISSATLGCLMTPARMIESVEVGGDLPFALIAEDVRRQLFLRPGTVLDALSSTPTPAVDALVSEQERRLVGFLAQSGYFGSTATISLTPIRAGGEPMLAMRVDAEIDAGEDVVLRDVIVVGDPALSFDEVDDELRHHWIFSIFPRRFTPLQLDEDLQALTRTLQQRGWPEARVEAEHHVDVAAGVVDVVVAIDAGPKVELSFEGNTSKTDRALRRLETFSEAGSADAVELDETAAEIRDAYQRDGHHAVSVTPQVSTSTRTRGRARSARTETKSVVYSITEGPTAELTSVELVGASTITEARLRRVELRTRASGLFTTGRWVDADVERDVRDLRRSLVEQGFAVARVTAERRVVAPGRLAAIFRIEEGPRRTIGTVRLTGLPPEVDVGAVMEHLALVPGAPFVADELGADRRAVLTALAAEGFVDAEVRRAMTLPYETEAGEVHVEYRVTPGARARFGGYWVRGNFRTRESVMRYELELEPGRPLDLVALTRARQRLRELGVFGSVELVPLDAWLDAPETWLLVDVTERTRRTLDLTASFATDDQLGLGFDLRDPNFLGRAIHLTLSTRLSNASGLFSDRLRIGNLDAVQARLHAPHPLGLPFDADYSLFYRYQDTPRFFERRVGLVAGVSRVLVTEEDCRWCPRVALRLGYELTAAAGTFLDEVDQGTVPIARVVPSLSFRRLDALIDPRSGYSGDLRVELARGALAGPIEGGASFWRVLASPTVYWKLGTPFLQRSSETTSLGGPVVLATGLQLGLGRPLGGTTALPFTEALYYGGDLSVRGLQQRASAAAFPNARQLLVANLELRWYFLTTGAGAFQLAGLADFGTVGDGFRDLFDVGTLSVGGVFRWVTLVGPLSVAYAVPVVLPEELAARPEVASPRGRLHVYFGYAL
ncbi:BamA/TamA family outer membrane protein [Myxococcota bacterium]|nr:BamA/TamA family outer membrane protein [Myxococcota bacterium]